MECAKQVCAISCTRFNRIVDRWQARELENSSKIRQWPTNREPKKPLTSRSSASDIVRDARRRNVGTSPRPFFATPIGADGLSRILNAATATLARRWNATVRPDSPSTTSANAKESAHHAPTQASRSSPANHGRETALAARWQAAITGLAPPLLREFGQVVWMQRLDDLLTAAEPRER